MKKVIMLAFLAIAVHGITNAQTTPAPKKAAKKEATAPVAKDTTAKAKPAAHAHAKKHAKS